MRGNSVARSLIQRMASRFSRNGSMSSTSGRCCRTSLFASSKVCAAPQTRYLSSRPTIVAIPCSLTQVSPTTTTRIGCAPVEAVGLFLTFCESTNRSGPLQSFNCVFCEKYSYGILSSTKRVARSSRKARDASQPRRLRACPERSRTGQSALSLLTSAECIWVSHDQQSAACPMMRPLASSD